jgi:putative acetyltransferase
VLQAGIVWSTKRIIADMTLHISLEGPAQPEIMGLLRDGEKYSAELYPAESNHHLALDALRSSKVRVFVARDEGRAVATGALVLRNSWGEIKRMWVVPDVRESGVSKAVLAALEVEARRERVSVLRLETGVQNHAALGLYKRAGHMQRGRFGNCQADPLSVFMEKTLL